ncbi:MAG: zonular occludens toxin domain-containing protein [Pseudomonadota bacterium]
MITLITGLPGSGKTLLVVARFVKPIMGTTVEEKLDDGTVKEWPRIIITNINGLVLDHERIEFVGELGLENWHLWCKPGAFFIIDEVQGFWKKRPNGSAVPPAIQALETHRHMGVDFVVMTQGTGLIDQNLMVLVDRHLHVRRMGSTQAAMVYEWDGCSRTLAYRNASNTKPFFYPRWAYKLYKSARVHTKQTKKLPAVMWMLLLAIVAMAFIGPKVYASLMPKAVEAKKEAPAAAAIASTPKSASVSYTTVYEGTSPPPSSAYPSLQELTVTPAASRDLSGRTTSQTLGGCVRYQDACTCYDQDAKPVPAYLYMCEAELDFGPVKAGPARPLPQLDVPELVDPIAVALQGHHDGQVLGWMRSRKPQ